MQLSVCLSLCLSVCVSGGGFILSLSPWPAETQIKLGAPPCNTFVLLLCSVVMEELLFFDWADRGWQPLREKTIL